MIDRIQLLIKSKNLTASKFADEIGVQRSGISHILSGRNNPGYDFIQKILIKYPQISAEWLILGKGEMYKSVNTSMNKQPEPNADINTLFDEDQPKYEKITDVNKSNFTESYSAKQEVSTQPAKQPSDIERIVIFYPDNTFREYKPGK